MMFRIGIISDTHGLLRPEAERRLTGVDHIVHAGDIGRPEIVEALRRIAPVSAIRGNVDSGEWARAYPDTKLVRLAGKSIYVLHDLKTLQVDPGAGIDVIVSGHSHVPKIDTVGGVLYLNPGSAGRRRFKLPITLVTLEVTPEGMRPENPRPWRRLNAPPRREAGWIAGSIRSVRRLGTNRSLFARTFSLAHDFLRPFVGPEPEIDGLAKFAFARPFREFHLGYQRRPDPGRGGLVLHFGRKG
jgi:putative phosphoesterase